MSTERSQRNSAASEGDEQPVAPANSPSGTTPSAPAHGEPTESTNDVYYAETFTPVGGNFRSDR